MTAKITEMYKGGEVINFGADLITPRQAMSTGIPAWDEVCEETGGEGISDWHYVVLGGASNAGKTHLMGHLCRQSVEQQIPTGIITMEVPTRGMQRRHYANVAPSFGYYDFRHKNWINGDAVQKTKKLRDEIVEYAGGNRHLYVAEHEFGTPNLNQIQDTLEVLYGSGCRTIFLDHLQLIKAPNDQIADRATEISEVLRIFAHKRPCRVVALSQLNRMASRERDRMPTMHDLWGGTAIESNANMVVMIDHSRMEEDEEHSYIKRTYLFIDKNRDGPNRRLIPVEINFKTGAWREAKPDEEHLWPE